jgi:hypothetical protein
MRNGLFTLNNNAVYEYIPATNQDGYFRVLERYQFKAVLCNNGRSLIKSTNEEVISAYLRSHGN